MLKPKSNALEVIRITLGKITGVRKPVSKFVIHILELWLGMNCRYVFTNMERWGVRNEKSYRHSFKKFFDWFGFNYGLVEQHCSSEVLAVFDPSYISKSGKHTHGVDLFWSSIGQRMMRGLEVGCLSFVDVKNATALHGVAIQTPCIKALRQAGLSLVSHYRSLIENHLKPIQKLTRYLAVDGYFMKREFIKPLLEQGLHIITKARQDANLKYLYNGSVRKGKGRQRKYAGKVDTFNIDKRRIKCCYRDNKGRRIYGGVVYCVRLKQVVLAAFLYDHGKDKPEIIIGTDTQMDAVTLCKYYSLRFQIEFLIRDAKQYAGLEDCQARDEKKLHSHFNIALTTVSVAKAAYYLGVPEQQKMGFSMADIKMLHMNQLIVKRIFSNLAVDLSCRKIKRIYDQCLSFGRLRA